jgi:hypothetical protein
MHSTINSLEICTEQITITYPLLYLKISGSPVLQTVSQRCCSFLCYVVTCCVLCASPAGCVVT